MGALDTTPRHAVRNYDEKLCFFVLEFIQILIAFGTDLENLNRDYMGSNIHPINEEVIADLSQWL